MAAVPCCLLAPCIGELLSGADRTAVICRENLEKKTLLPKQGCAMLRRSPLPSPPPVQSPSRPLIPKPPLPQQQPPPSLPSSPPPVTNIYVFMRLKPAAPEIPKPDRQFGRDINCSNLADIISANLMKVAAQAQLIFSSPLQVTACNDTTFRMTGAVVYDPAACVATESLLEASWTLSDWLKLAMTENRNCTASPDIRAAVSLHSYGPMGESQCIDLCRSRIFCADASMRIRISEY
ncbi:hypothetical protein VOLCADRAFT_91400 [Volvox carteri f. nagariensis]|uniref:Pherophorin domain-containing protein n=1 Tax=Volvox carteri f. nagariensis TaxID=3068 RepID=D8TWZ2_VOLCA|nr:uncharacterized protein VOLCADRAFT_91400 [Volvox carteri f. nagariensis]EFJ47819.1 hypothetical protein VOLCADRAFT_91400 [Volvox carteri f. nagariensis]|eukprot:XP_002950925.1 hypothetical protein VOLCADRAFT_91400 [Volvox carteri f. nagariensis]